MAIAIAVDVDFLCDYAAQVMPWGAMRNTMRLVTHHEIDDGAVRHVLESFTDILSRAA